MIKSGFANRGSSGFTLIELMVATLVFSVVLLVVTSGIIQVTRLYCKGVNEANTQNTARSVMDAISQAIQFSGAAVTPTPARTPGVPQSFCIGDQLFSYELGYQLVDDTPDASKHQANHVLVAKSVAGCNSSTPSDFTGGTELLTPNTRLADLSIQNISGDPGSKLLMYKVTIRVVYGDSDLLYSPSAPAGPHGDLAADAQCVAGRIGTQFCAFADLTSVVTRRIGVQ